MKLIELELIKNFVSTFAKYESDSIVVKQLSSEKELNVLESLLPAKLPNLYKVLILNYCFNGVNIDGYYLFGNELSTNFNRLKEQIFNDKHLYPTLFKYGYIQFGKGEQYSDYNPVCFDTKNNGSLGFVVYEY